MSKAEILAELPNLSAEDRAEIQNRIEELAREGWLDGGEVTESDKALLAGRLAAYDRNPGAGSSFHSAYRCDSQRYRSEASGWAQGPSPH